MSNLSPMLGDDPPPPRRNPVPPPPRSGVSVAWVFLSAMIGFMLPVFACGFLIFATFVSFGAFATSFDTAETETGPGIGVLDLTGPITTGNGIGASSERMLEAIDWLEDERDVRAVVVLANSPGGDANASDVIWNRLSQMSKPVYVAIDGICASGCYYIAMAATPDQIYATPNSLVGSIGVISTFFNVDELLEDIGVDINNVTTGGSKDFGSPFREMTPDEEQYWRDQINVVYENFITVVSGGRANHLTRGDVRELADGRVWAASISQNLGLIDGILYPEEVMDEAANQVKLGRNYRVIRAPIEPTFLDLFSASSAEVEPLLDGSIEVELPTAQDLLNSMQQSSLQYRYYGPFSGEWE